MSKGEFNSVAQANGGMENMINWEGKDKDLLALIKYIADEDKLEKVLENPQVIKTPVVRNGKQSTLGYQPDIWKGWKQKMNGMDKMFDFNKNGKLDNWERAAKFQFLEKMWEEEKRKSAPVKEENKRNTGESKW